MVQPKVGILLYDVKSKSHCCIIYIDDFLGIWKAQWVDGPLQFKYFNNPINKTWKKDWKIAKAYAEY